MSKISIISDYFGYLKSNKKWWLLPIVVCLILLGALIVLAHSSAIAPFIYTLF